MPRKKIKKKAVEVKEEVKEIKEDKIEVSVYNNEMFVRSFTLEAHGKDFKKLAQGFAKKKGYSCK